MVQHVSGHYMNLTEHQAKHILRGAGVRVPNGGLSKSVEQAVEIAETLPQSNCVIKAQIRAGGRSQGHFKNDSQSRGGIRFVSSPAQAKACSAQMLNNILITDQTGPAGELVESVYVEEHVHLRSEKYLALTIDNNSGSLMFIASNAGGVQIEHLAQQSPDQIARFKVDIRQPEPPADIADIGLNEQGELCVLDATIIWDDNALFRQGHEEQMIAFEDLSESEFKAKCLGLNYFELDGNVGTVTAGAGLAMALLDSLHDTECKPANFMDIPPSSSIDNIRQAISLVLLNEKVEVLFINIIGGGIMRCDAVSDALLILNEEQEINIPLVVRLAGTNSSLAIERLKASMPNSFVTTDLSSAIAAAAASSIVSAQATTKSQTTKSPKATSTAKKWWQRAKKATEMDH